ncbi:atp4 subunit B of the stator stalk of mitochondrial F1F0 ATP synthase, partial [Coelomomyces lativittatus]
NNASAPEIRMSPEEKAKKLVDNVPESKFLSKTSTITLGTGALAYALSKEIYVFNEESLLLFAFIGFSTMFYKLVKDPICNWADGRIEHIYNILRKAREEHRTLVKEKVDSVAEASNIVEVTNTLFDMSREMTELESKAFELKQKTTLVSEMKSVLDAWVRHEASVRERQQKLLANQILERLNKLLEDPKIQTEILNQSIADIESISLKRN